MNRRQIEKLRRKFFLLSSVSFIFVMLFIGGMMYLTNHIVLQSQTRSSLNKIASADGHISSQSSSGTSSGEYSETGADTEAAVKETEQAAAEPAETEPSDTETETDPDSSFFHDPTFFEAFGATGYLRQLSESRMTMRFFAVLYDADGNFEKLRSNLIRLPSDEYAIDAADKILAAVGDSYKSRKQYGTYGIFSYLVTERSSGGPIVVFLDVSSNINDSNRLLYTALILIGFGSTAILVVMRILSFHVIQPEIRNARLQKQFITNASHELKTPLAVIRANTELEQMINGENEWNQSTLRQVDRMNGLIANLVMIARSEEKENSGEMTTLDVSALISETASTFRPVALQEGKQFETNIPGGIMKTVEESDIRHLASVLIDNAIKYCDDNGMIAVSLASVSRGRQIRLEVSNTYAAGKDTDYSRFFNRFYREDESHSTNADRGGYGIGLSIAETLVNKYHGSINASWKDGRIQFKAVL